MIEHMGKTGKIDKTKEYNVYRTGNQVTKQEEESNSKLTLGINTYYIFRTYAS
jgi:hypothetical protein